MSISNGAYQNELEKLPISTGNPVWNRSKLFWSDWMYGSTNNSQNNEIL